MRIKIISKLLLKGAFFLVLMGLKSVYAESPDYLGMHRMTASSLGLGGATTAVADGADAFYKNPAGLSRKSEYRYMHLGNRFIDNFRNWGVMGGFIDGKTQEPLAWGFLFNYARSKREARFQDYSLATSYGFSHVLMIGLGHRLSNYDRAQFTPNRWVYSLNPGVLLFVSDQIAFGASIDGAFRSYSDKYASPFVYRGGASLNFKEWRASLDVERNESLKRSYLRTGAEGHLMNSLILRGGFFSDAKQKDIGYTLGLGYEPSTFLQLSTGFMDQLKSSTQAYLADLSVKF